MNCQAVTEIGIAKQNEKGCCGSLTNGSRQSMYGSMKISSSPPSLKNKIAIAATADVSIDIERRIAPTATAPARCSAI
jgi:hypothetical protein